MTCNKAGMTRNKAGMTRNKAGMTLIRHFWNICPCSPFFIQIIEAFQWLEYENISFQTLTRLTKQYQRENIT